MMKVSNKQLLYTYQHKNIIVLHQKGKYIIDNFHRIGTVLSLSSERQLCSALT